MNKVDVLKERYKIALHPMSNDMDLEMFAELAFEVLPTLFEVFDNVSDTDDGGNIGYWSKGTFYTLPELEETEVKSDIQITAENEEKIVRAIVDNLGDAGWHLIGVNDGEEFVKTSDVESALDTIFSVEESYILFEKNNKIKEVYLICGNGNDGFDLITDHSTGDGFDEILDAITDEIDAKISNR